MKLKNLTLIKGQKALNVSNGLSNGKRTCIKDYRVYLFANDPKLHRADRQTV